MPTLLLALVLSAAWPPDARWMDVEGVRVPVPPPEHPRLYLRARDLGDLKRRTTHPALKPVWDQLQELAKKNVQIHAEVGALKWLLGRQEEPARRTIAEALELLEKSVFPADVQDITRPIGRMMVTGAAVYDWCYPLLTAEQKQRFVAQLLRLARQLEGGYPPRDIGSVTGHGSEWIVMRDMVSAGIAIYDEFPEMYCHAAARIFGKHIPARNWWYAGHAFHQGTAYAETRVSSELYPLWIFDRLGAGNVYNPSQQFVAWLWIYLRRPDGQLMRGGDGQYRVPKLRSLLTASYYGDGYVLSDYLKSPGIDPMNKLFEFLWSDPDLKPLPISDLPLSRYMGFPFGWMVARTGWDEESAIAEMKVNIYQFNNHQHLDAGAFQIYYKGPLAIDSGLYQGTSGGYTSPHCMNYYRRTIAHNSLLIYDPSEKFERPPRFLNLSNDGGQRLPNQWREPRSLEELLQNDYKTGTVLGHGFGPDFQRPEYTYLKGDLTEAYSAKVREVKRSFVFLNLGRRGVPAALVVFDRVVSSNPEFKKYWLLHSLEEPAVAGNSVTVTLSQKHRWGMLVNTTLWPEPGNAEIAKVGGPGKEFWVFGTNYPNELTRPAPPDEYEIGAWRIELSPKRASAADLFLNVMQTVDRDTSRPFPVERLDSADLTGARIADRVVLFRPDGRRADRPVSFTVSGGERLKYLVTDLAEGTWQLWRDGAIVKPAVPVGGDDGVMYFEGPPGAYTLRR